GAQFIVTPVSKKSVIQTAHRYDTPIFSGAFSPGEILTAFEQGADVVKLFPAEVLGIPFLKAIKAPMPQLQLMPTGGVTVANVGDWIRAGACAVGVGSALTDPGLIESGNYPALTERATLFREQVKLARTSMSQSGNG
ncbi:MAG: bifunctional 4-hydroxy-2-oxoglutarate aldolase/2-dehydro-3-deoxy-phosphogluconate aldolase, partial [Bacteroidetes bacterium]|nr:bifunctional 4-hydroxy-2-oxoglutarate aldolase/2-dehydro-3-deoxy-phosphogluconate aldolase [Fibrella sp.]